MVSHAWTAIKTISLKRAWNKINGTSTKQQIQEEKEETEMKKDEESVKNSDEDTG